MIFEQCQRSNLQEQNHWTHYNPNNQTFTDPDGWNTDHSVNFSALFLKLSHIGVKNKILTGLIKIHFCQKYFLKRNHEFTSHGYSKNKSQVKKREPKFHII